MEITGVPGLSVKQVAGGLKEQNTDVPDSRRAIPELCDLGQVIKS